MHLLPVSLAASGLAFVLSVLSCELIHADEISFAQDILPILSDKCFVCHGPDGTDREVLQLDTSEQAMLQRDNGRAIDRENPEQSSLLKRIHSADDPMPPADAEKQLTPAERDLLTRWVRAGAEWETHWSFIPPRKVTPPVAVATAAEVIDAYISDRLAARDAKPAPAADRRTLARRAALVLTGLPPQPAQLQAFLQDDTGAAWGNYLDELLSSPRFGEHQARYWLDAVRYGDTHGLHLDNKRGIFPWRDWVVHALNRNQPLDEFLVWQLAGDLLPAATLEQQVATGFVRMNPSTAEGGVIPEEFQAKNNFDRVETLGTVLLGMSMTCARCHNHKYDPITQQEYYGLLAFFNSTAESPLDGNKYEYAPVLKAPASVSAWGSWQGLQQQLTQLIQQAQELVAGQSAQQQEQWHQAASAARLQLLAAAEGAFAGTPLQEQAVQLQQQLTDLEAGYSTTLVAQELEQPRATHLLRRGEYDLPAGDPLQPEVPAVMGRFPSDQPRNRLGLARWLVSREQPLVSRVLVNQIWQRVFGDGLVRTPEDFGLQGQQPTHPELLDWLAVELQDSGWNLKGMLKQILMSQTFRQSSAWREELSDPENRLLGRGPRYRLDAEVIRDIGLWSSGLLADAMGGEGSKPYQPEGLWSALMHPASNTKNYEQDTGQKLYQRSLYMYWKRTCPHPMLTLFDAPSRESSCIRRSRTNTALQSLGLLNETQRVEMGRELAVRLLKSLPSDDARINLLFELLACREASASEREACQALVDEMRRRFRQSPEDAQALLSAGESKATVDLPQAEMAAWTQLTVTVLASDAALLLY